MSDIPQCAIDLIKRFEQLRLSAYPDPGKGWAVPTVGYGCTVYPSSRRVEKGHKITAEYAEECLLYHLDHVCLPALRRIPTWPLMNEHQCGALMSFAYNMGDFYGRKNRESITALCDMPPMWGDKEYVRRTFGLYQKSHSVTLTGLIRRREAEAELFCRPVEEGEAK